MGQSALGISSFPADATAAHIFSARSFSNIPNTPNNSATRSRSVFAIFQLACVISPALGGVIIGYEVARALGVRSLFVERDRSGQMTLRRGFEIKPGERVLVIEDVWTTGGSTRETIGVVEQEGGLVVAAGALIDRTGGTLELNVPARALVELAVPSYEPDDCPQCHAGRRCHSPRFSFRALAAVIAVSKSPLKVFE